MAQQRKRGRWCFVRRRRDASVPSLRLRLPPAACRGRPALLLLLLARQQRRRRVRRSHGDRQHWAEAGGGARYLQGRLANPAAVCMCVGRSRVPGSLGRPPCATHQRCRRAEQASSPPQPGPATCAPEAVHEGGDGVSSGIRLVLMHGVPRLQWRDRSVSWPVIQWQVAMRTAAGTCPRPAVAQQQQQRASTPPRQTTAACARGAPAAAAPAGSGPASGRW